MLPITTEALNQLVVEGTLVEMNFREGKKERNGVMRDYLGGTVTIRVTQEIGGVEETHDVQISSFANKLTNDGRENSAYKNLQAMRNSFVSLGAGGPSADTVRVNKGEIRENSFRGDDGSIVTGFRLQNAFYNRVRAESEQIAAFNAKIVILSMGPEINYEGEETNRLKIVGAIVAYQGRLNVITYFVEDPTAVAYISKNWEEGNTVNISGRVRFAIENIQSEAPVADIGFGEALPVVKTRVVKELIITSGSPGPLDEDESYDTETDIPEALASRKAYLASLPMRDAQSDSATPAAAKQKAKFDPGF